VLLLGAATQPERVCDSCWDVDRQWSITQTNKPALEQAASDAGESPASNQLASSVQLVATPVTEEEALLKANGVRVSNTSGEELPIKVYNGDDSICLYSYDGQQLAPGTEGVCQGYPDEDNNVQVYINGIYYTASIGQSYTWTGLELRPSTATHAHMTPQNQQGSCQGLSQQEFECADQMIRMCSQYLALVARKLRYELPKMVFSDLLVPSAKTEMRLKEIIRDETTGILDVMVSEPAESKQLRASLEERLHTLDRIQELLKSSEFSSLTESASASA